MELKTPLYDAHVKAGGKIVPFAGFLHYLVTLQVPGTRMRTAPALMRVISGVWLG